MSKKLGNVWDKLLSVEEKNKEFQRRLDSQNIKINKLKKMIYELRGGKK